MTWWVILLIAVGAVALFVLIGAAIDIWATLRGSR